MPRDGWSAPDVRHYSERFIDLLLIRPNGPTHPRAGFRHVTPEVRQTAASVASKRRPWHRRDRPSGAPPADPLCRHLSARRSRWTDKSLTLRSRSSVKEKALQRSSGRKRETPP